tara:strand:- start:248 stop:526 length:279 start_codon:yes stop_codon:yes gene_type:complete
VLAADRPAACAAATAVGNTTPVGVYHAKVDASVANNYVTYTAIANDYTWPKADMALPCPATSSQFYPMPTSGTTFNNEMKAYLCSKKLFGLC